MQKPSPVAIVTAASQGIGEGIARELSKRGYRLALMSRSERCLEVAEELGALGLRGTVTAAAHIDALVEQTMERYGRIDAVVNNSGRHVDVLREHIDELPAVTSSRLNYDADFDDDILAVPDQAWHNDLDLIVLNCMRMARAVTPIMIEQGGGSIVNISGMEAAQPRVVYPLGPIRLALHGYTKIYSDRYGRDGIRMNCVLPGIMENAESDAGHLTNAIPLGRLGGIPEVAKSVAFLLSGDASYITGQMLVVDGGLNRLF